METPPTNNQEVIGHAFAVWRTARVMYQSPSLEDQREARAIALRTRHQKDKQMPFITTPERLGLEKGLLKGIAKMLQFRFGETGLGLMPEIQAIEDNEKLEAILDAATTVNSPQELRSIWFKGTANQST